MTFSTKEFIAAQTAALKSGALGKKVEIKYRSIGPQLNIEERLKCIAKLWKEQHSVKESDLKLL